MESAESPEKEILPIFLQGKGCFLVDHTCQRFFLNLG